ncbi:oligopeptide/dipeptide ABC transporter ATP-binding protein [Streptomyces sp. NPDC013157]|uniref:oligopeptide/dipeptide ABC transporter ATP-binding protein n=1 Tax=Streptomyces sp. NPDC013157 TaxID=3364861 RepID=UPI00367DD896
MRNLAGTRGRRPPGQSPAGPGRGRGGAANDSPRGDASPRADLAADPAALEVRDLQVRFPARAGRRGEVVHAVRGVSLTVAAGSAFGLVGESGSGKSTLARAALGLLRSSSGTSLVGGTDITTARRAELRTVRRDAAMVFQNPVAALNPRRTAAASVGEPLRLQGLGRAETVRRTAALLDQVGLTATHGARLPHELSGGQCQRVGIARALATSPRLLVLDEPTSALDVSVQAQILNLLLDLKASLGFAFLLISHDLDVVRHMSDTLGVMYRGRLVESGPAGPLLASPAHPYTRALLDSVPGQGREHLLDGLPEPPGSSAGPEEGCAYRSRCPLESSRAADGACATTVPLPRPAGPEGVEAACHLATVVTTTRPPTKGSNA